MKEIIRAFKALGDETRLRLLKLLEQRELCVCELMQALNMTQSRVSRNLGILKNAGFIKDRREGLWVHYSLNYEDAPTVVRKLLPVLRELSNDDAIIIKDLLELSKAKKLSETDNEES